MDAAPETKSLNGPALDEDGEMVAARPDGEDDAGSEGGGRNRRRRGRRGGRRHRREDGELEATQDAGRARQRPVGAAAAARRVQPAMTL